MLLLLSARGAKRCLVSRRWQHHHQQRGPEDERPSNFYNNYAKNYATYLPSSAELEYKFDPSTAPESSLCPLFVPPSFDDALASEKHIRFDRLQEFQGVPATASDTFNALYLKRYRLKGSDLVQLSRLLREQSWNFVSWSPQRMPAVESYLVSFLKLYARFKKQWLVVNLTTAHLQEVRSNLLLCLAAKARPEVFLTHLLRRRVRHNTVKEEEDWLKQLIEAGNHGLSLDELTACVAYFFANRNRDSYCAAARIFESNLEKHLPAYEVMLRYCNACVHATCALDKAVGSISLMQTLGMSPEEKKQAAACLTPVHEAYLQSLRQIGGYSTLAHARTWLKNYSDIASYEARMLFLRGLASLAQGIIMWRQHRDADPSVHVFFDSCVRNQLSAKGLVLMQWLERTSYHAFDLPLQHELFPVQKLQRLPCNNVDEFKNFLTGLKARYPAVKRVVVLDDDAAEMLANKPETLVKSEEKDSVLFLLTSAVLGNLYILKKPTLRCLLALVEEGRFLAEFVHSREEAMCHRTVVELRLMIPVQFPPMYEPSRLTGEWSQWQNERREIRRKDGKNRKRELLATKARMPIKSDDRTIDHAAVLSAFSRSYTTGFVVKEILEPQGVEVRLCAGKRREPSLRKAGMTGVRLEQNEKYRMYQYEEVMESNDCYSENVAPRQMEKVRRTMRSAATVAHRFASSAAEHEEKNEWATAQAAANDEHSDTETMRINRFLSDPRADVQEVYGYSNAEVLQFEGEQRRLSREQKEDDGDEDYIYPTDDELSDDDDDDADDDDEGEGDWYSVPVP